jgi:malate permease and related proteins
LKLSQRWPQDWLGLQSETHKGSFVLSSMLGNTGFVGLAIAASILNPDNLGLAAFFTVMHNAMGLYGAGVLVADHFGEREEGDKPSHRPWWKSLLAVVKVPSLWAFLLGASTQSVAFSEVTEVTLQKSIWVVIPCGFLLMGMRLSQLKSLRSLTSGIVPALIKVVLMPTMIALITPLLGIVGEPRLALVLMAGTPTALTALVLAEEYNLDRELIASSIAISMLLLIPLIPLWLTLLS